MNKLSNFDMFANELYFLTVSRRDSIEKALKYVYCRENHKDEADIQEVLVWFREYYNEKIEVDPMFYDIVMSFYESYAIDKNKPLKEYALFTDDYFGAWIIQGWLDIPLSEFVERLEVSD